MYKLEEITLVTLALRLINAWTCQMCAYTLGNSEEWWIGNKPWRYINHVNLGKLKIIYKKKEGFKYLFLHQ